MKLNKKGMFFTFIAMGLVSLIVYSFAIHTGYVYRDSMFVIDTRVTTIGNFIKDVETDAGRGLYISSFRALLAMQDHIVTNNSFISDVPGVFEEALLNSTVENQSNNLIENASFYNWVERMQLEAQKLDIDLNITAYNVVLSQSDPWTVQVDMDVDFNISDKKDTARWNRQKHITINIDIGGFEDPVYSLNTYGKVSNMVIKANSTNFANINILKEYLDDSYYIASARGPDYLMRLSGNMSSSPNGIESIVNIRKIIIQGLTPKITSNIDFYYFGNYTNSSCIINETYNETNHNWFRLDDVDSTSLSTYNVSCN